MTKRHTIDPAIDYRRGTMTCKVCGKPVEMTRDAERRRGWRHVKGAK